MRRLVTLACLVLCARAFADGGRVRWLGVSGDGHVPATLDKAGVAHVAVALRQLGLTLVSLPPSSAEASASCVFATPRLARCLVEVQSSSGTKAERHAQIPFHDAEDLAESLALIVSDMLTTKFPEVVTPPPAPPPTPPPPETPPTTPTPPHEEPPPRPPKRESEADRQRAAAAERAHQAELARQADYEERAREPERNRQARAPVRLGPGHLILEAAAAGLFTLGPANPTIGGGLVRVLWAGGPLRAGGTLSLGGSSQSAGNYALGWFRGLAAARVGAGVRRGTVEFDATAGPAFLLAYADAHAAGHHLLTSIAFVVGPHLSIGLGRDISVALGADLQLAVTEEKVVSGSTSIAQLSHVALEATLGLSWRR